MKVLITGNTGFKGSWLTLMLSELGYEIYGVALKPKKQSLFEIAKVRNSLSKQYFVDIRNYKKLRNIFSKSNPDLVIHLAAQALVKESYANPRSNLEINTNGTFNVLEAIKYVNNIKGSIIITTDKVYKNDESNRAYIETDPLGGKDPYSSSKAMADLLTQSWAMTYSNSPMVIARAGNVVGGGDFSEDRLIPDLFKAYASKSTLKLRHSFAVRPWQHVLDCLKGYLSLIENIHKLPNGSAWNFGPNRDSVKNVLDVVKYFQIYTNWQINWTEEQEHKYYEAQVLSLDSSKSENVLGWSNSLNFEETISLTAKWYRALFENKNMRKFTIDQVKEYLEQNKLFKN